MTTNDTLDPHRPTDAFRDYLEDEVIHEFRRRRTFRRLRAAAIVIVSIGIGASATLASAQVRQSSARDSLLSAAQADAMLAGMRLNLAKAQLAEEQKQVKAGTRPAGVLPSEGTVAELEAALAKISLDMAEIRATSRSPRDELNAPLVNGRDFVKERLQIQLMIAQRRLDAAQQKFDEASRRARVGAGSELESADYESGVRRRYGELAVLAEQLNARTEFLEKGTDIRQLTLRIEKTEVQQALQAGQLELRNAQSRYDLAAQRQKAGAATDLEVLEAQLNLRIQQLELQKLMKRLESLKSSGNGEGDQLAGGPAAR
jgi:hypothetical protein